MNERTQTNEQENERTNEQMNERTNKKIVNNNFLLTLLSLIFYHSLQMRQSIKIDKHTIHVDVHSGWDPDSQPIRFESGPIFHSHYYNTIERTAPVEWQSTRFSLCFVLQFQTDARANKKKIWSSRVKVMDWRPPSPPYEATSLKWSSEATEVSALMIVTVPRVPKLYPFNCEHAFMVGIHSKWFGKKSTCDSRSSELQWISCIQRTSAHLHNSSTDHLPGQHVQRILYRIVKLDLHAKIRIFCVRYPSTIARDSYGPTKATSSCEDHVAWLHPMSRSRLVLQRNALLRPSTIFPCLTTMVTSFEDHITWRHVRSRSRHVHGAFHTTWGSVHQFSPHVWHLQSACSPD